MLFHDVGEVGHGHGHDHEAGQDLPSESLQLKSVGIDIGSTTSHLLVSLVTLRRQRDRLSSLFKVVARETVYESPIILTPYCQGLTIDTEQLRLFIEESYRQAGLTPGGIDTGAVITTGEAAKKDNASAITALFSAWAGRFVCATAGPHLEARIAAYGSGAVRQSLASGEPVLNLDIGGGSTKLALACDGVVIATAALAAGARLVAFQSDGTITRLEEPGRLVLEAMGLAPKLGDKLALADQEAMARTLARCVREFVQGDTLSPLTRQLLITSPLAPATRTRKLVLSGGVSEYFYGREVQSFGDLGPLLANAVREELRDLPLQVESGERGIRSTVIGAAEYTVQVSGSSIYLSREDLLPLHNVPVIPLRLDASNLTVDGVAAAVLGELAEFEADDGPVCLGIHWEASPSYHFLEALAKGMERAWAALPPQRGASSRPRILIFDEDIGRLAGRILAAEVGPGVDVISLDGIATGELNYVDIGAKVGKAGVVPVMVKSLLFRP